MFCLTRGQLNLWNLEIPRYATLPFHQKHAPVFRLLYDICQIINVSDVQFSTCHGPPVFQPKTILSDYPQLVRLDSKTHLAFIS